MDVTTLIGMRGARGFADGVIAVLLPVHLGLLGYSTTQVGLVASATMLGSAALTLTVGLAGGAWERRSLLLAASVLMITTGLVFAVASGIGVLLAMAFIGTMNASAGDVSIFLPTEQAIIPDVVPEASRTRTFAHYALAGSLAGALGSLAAGLPERLADTTSLELIDVTQLTFLIYSVVGVIGLFAYRRLSDAVEAPSRGRSAALGTSRRTVLRLAALFSLDSFGSGFSGTAMVALWLFLRFDLSIATTGLIFFWSSVLTSLSMLLAPRLAARIGLVRTMVFTHIPANVLLILAGLMPSLTLAVSCLLLRSLLSTMDVPARTSYTMSVVPAEHRSAAAAVTNVPRSLAAVPGPVLAGVLLSWSSAGWPLVIAGSIKIVYDVALLAMFGATDVSGGPRRSGDA